MKYLIVVLMMFPNTLGSSMASPVLHTFDIRREEVKIEVVATMYQPKLSQTDSTPHILADGTRINVSRVVSVRGHVQGFAEKVGW